MLDEFFLSTADGFINPRADEEIAKYRKFSEDGKKGAAKRWHKDTNGEANSPPNATPIATNNHKPITNNHKPIKDKATSVATPVGVSPEVWDQFVKQRKVKKAQITDLVMAGIQREADKAGYTLEKALTEVVVRNWTSFKADWVLEKQTATQKAAANMALLTRGMTAPKPANFWDKTTTLEMIHDEPKRIL